jgi:hypothetical protein
MHVLYAPQTEETEGKIEELDKEKKRLHKLIQAEKSKRKTASFQVQMYICIYAKKKLPRPRYRCIYVYTIVRYRCI